MTVMISNVEKCAVKHSELYNSSGFQKFSIFCLDCVFIQRKVTESMLKQPKILYAHTSLGQKKKYVCFLFHPVKSLGRVGRLSFFFFNFFYNLILTTNIQHIKVAHNLEHRSGISRHVV